MSEAFDISNLAAGRIVLPAASLLLLLLFAPACAVFRSVKKSVSDSTSFKQVESQSNTTLNAEINRDMVFSYIDSDKISYRVEIIPEGEFSYSPGAVFKGRAKSLTISGKEASWKAGSFMGAEEQQLWLDSAGTTVAKSEVQVKNVSRSLHRKNGGRQSILLLIFLLLVGLLSVRIWRRI